MVKIEPNCPVCSGSLKPKQYVILDQSNNLIHEDCSIGRKYKDKGTVEEILYKNELVLGD